MAGRVGSWLAERYRFGAVRDFARHKVVPLHRASGWYFLGGMALFLFLVQVVTGSLLLLYYRPSSGEAHESVQFVMSRVSFGWLVRSLHAWSANLMVLVGFVHMFSTYFLRSYRKPRELTWVTGCVLFALVLGLGFSGYLLPWNTTSYFATKVGTELPEVLPFVGSALVRFLRGGNDVTGATLTRFFGWHVMILPGLTMAVLAVHLVLIQAQGMSVPISVRRPVRSIRFLPDFLLHEALAWTLALGVLVALATFYPAELGVKADPFASAPAGIRPEWYFLFAFQSLKVLPSHVLGLEGETVGVLALGLLGLVWVLVPFLDRRASRGERSPLFTAIGVAVVAYVVGMTVYGWMAS